METLTKTRIILNSRKKKNARLYSTLSDVEYYADAAKLYEDGAVGIEEDFRKYKAAEAALDGQDVGTLRKDKTEVYERLAEVNARLRGLRGEIRTCDMIGSMIPTAVFIKEVYHNWMINEPTTR